MLLPLIFIFQNCGKLESAETQNSVENILPTMPSDAAALGKTLFAQNCTGCHGGIETTLVKGIDGGQLLAAIRTEPAMAGLSFLSEEEVSNIAAALRLEVNPIPVLPPVVLISSPIENFETEEFINLVGTCTEGIEVSISGAGVAVGGTTPCSLGNFVVRVQLSSGDGVKAVNVSQSNSTGQSNNSRNFVVKAPLVNSVLVARINAGGPQVVDSEGLTWSADSSFTGGASHDYGAATNIVNSSDDILYRTVRYDAPAAPDLSYNFNLNNGSYVITLHFAEVYSGAFSNNARRFNVAVEGNIALNEFDIFNESGGSYRLITRAIQAQVNDGQLNIVFTHGASDNPFISALEIHASEGVSVQDTDGDGMPDVTDLDDDNDGVPDVQDLFPLDATETADNDLDGLGDNVDQDDDNDLVPDLIDNYPFNANLQFDGAQLYATNCASCHQSISETTKANRSQLSIQTAINSIGPMNNRANLTSLTPGQVGAISAAVTFSTCDENELLKPQIRRLTQKQYNNTVVSVFGNIFVDSDFPIIGDDNPTLGLENDPNNLTITEIKFERFYNSTADIVAKVLANNTSVRNCAQSGNVSCVSTQLSNLGQALWRRPLTNIEVNDINLNLSQVNGINGDNALRLRFILSSLLLSPNFLFRTEVGAIDGGQRLLNHYEVASLLSYTLWDSPPDATLYNLAAQGNLHDNAVLSQQVQRMSNDPKYVGAMSDFFTDFLKLKDVLTKEKDNSIFNITPAIRQSLMSSAELGLSSQISNRSSNFMDVFSGNSMYLDNNLAPLFGVNSSTTTNTLMPYSLPASQRNGILSHPAFLTSHSGRETSGIVHRGVFALEQLLCSPLGSPPDNISALPPGQLPSGFNPAEYSSRELLQITHSTQAQCTSCHVKIDPAGFGFENFDGFGRFRLIEKSVIPIDASGSLENVGSLNVTFENSIDYIQKISQSDQMKSCVIDNYFQYSLGQKASTNSCELQNFSNGVGTQNDTIQSLTNNLIQLNSFFRREQD